SLDYEGQAAKFFTVTLRVTDQHGLTFDQQFRINIGDVDETSTNRAPTSLSFADTSTRVTIDEHRPGALAGTLIGLDPDGDALTFSIAPGGDGNNLFEVVNNQLRLRQNVSLDFEGQDAKFFLVTVRATDEHGAFIDREFRIDIGNV